MSIRCITIIAILSEYSLLPIGNRYLPSHSREIVHKLLQTHILGPTLIEERESHFYFLLTEGVIQSQHKLIILSNVH